MEHVNGGATGQHAGLEAIVKANTNQDQPTVQHAQLKPDDFKVVRTLGTGEFLIILGLQLVGKRSIILIYNYHPYLK